MHKEPFLYHNMFSLSYNSPIGHLVINSDTSSILEVRLAGSGEYTPSSDPPQVVKQCVRETDEYFRGHRETFSVPVGLSGVTPFQKKVLEALRNVPFGSTVSYGKLAELAGVLNGGRAVGNVMNMNPVPIIIPCHRVIKADGTLGGFGMGVDIKKMLLLLEQNKTNNEALPWSVG